MSMIESWDMPLARNFLYLSDCRMALFMVVLLWKEFKLLSFDPDFAGSLGFPTGILDVVLTTLMVIAIVVGLQTVGVVLMSAMLVAPAAAARLRPR